MILSIISVAARNCGTLTKYSDVLPDGSFTPPPKTVVEVLWTWGVVVRVLVDEPFPPFRMVVPRSQLLTFLLDILALWVDSVEQCAGVSAEARPLRAP